MDKTKIALLTALVAVPVVIGLNFNVKVGGGPPKQASYNLQFDNNTSKLQEVNLSVRNIGSIPCNYRLKAWFRQGNKTMERFSEAKPLYPGEGGLIELKYVPLNYTGNVRAEVNVTFCDREERVKKFNFTVAGNLSTNNTVKSRTLDAESRTATVSFDRKNLLLVPQETPPLWKVPSVNTEGTTAEISYEPPVFNPARELEFTVLNASSHEILGETTVSLKESPTISYIIQQNKLKLLLSLSLLINLLLGYAAFKRWRK